MKFSEKYELLESVTKGQVRTFLGRDVASKTRVVVHIFDCPGNHSGQMAGQWVLQAFRNLAPSPLGQVLEVGSYEDSSYAYIVTKMPDAAALQAWVRAYRMHCGSTEDLSREPKPKDSDITTGSLDVNHVREALAEAAPEVHPAPETAQAPGEFTKAFWDLAGKPSARNGSGNSAGTPPSTVAPASMAASSSAEETRLRANAGPVAKAESASSQQKVGSSGEGFTEAFMRLGDASLSSPNTQVDSRLMPGAPPRPPAPDVVTDKPQALPILQRSARPEPGAFTKEFLSVLDAEPKSGKSSEPPIQEVPNDRPKQRSPGAFTREFLMVTEGSQQGSREIRESAANHPVASPIPTTAQNAFEERSPGEAGFTNLFQAAPAESKKPTPDVAPMPGNKAATGEFTGFFGGPFQAPVESQVPASFPDPLQSIPQKQEAGDFTRMFGSLKSEKGKSESLPISGNLAPSSVEKEDYVPPALERAEPPPPSGYGVLSFARKSVMAPPDGRRGPAEPWGGSAFPKPAEMPTKEPLFPPGEATVARHPGPAGATQVFVPRGGGAESITPVEKSGPGEFTRIISGGAPAQSLPAEAPIGSPSAEPRHFSMPSMPQIPGMAPPQMPPMQAPQMPAIASPQMPAFSMPQIPPPQAPPLPKAQAPSAGKMSYLPLIIIFNVLFIVAVLVVLYFAFKH